MWNDSMKGTPLEKYICSLEDAFHLMNLYGTRRTPFLFLFDFELIYPMIIPLADDFPATDIEYRMPAGILRADCVARANDSDATQKRALNEARTIASEQRRFQQPYEHGKATSVAAQTRAGTHTQSHVSTALTLRSFPVGLQDYARAFHYVQSQQRAGNSYLTNLTFPCPIELNATLTEIYSRSRALYRLLIKDRMVVFSPESFVRIHNDKIFSYPMKGTIDATLPDAEALLLENEKELAEHVTIVDLIRNDLSRVSGNVRVDRFRFIDRIATHTGGILQMSSRISGDLPTDYRTRLGDLFRELLPAGSVSGAPKRKTLDIIRQAEQRMRGYYTGVFGVFDGDHLDSAVMIRFIEQTEKGFIYQSGGGITIYSDLESEYRELLQKVYVPVD